MRKLFDDQKTELLLKPTRSDVMASIVAYKVKKMRIGRMQRTNQDNIKMLIIKSVRIILHLNTARNVTEIVMSKKMVSKIRFLQHANTARSKITLKKNVNTNKKPKEINRETVIIKLATSLNMMK